jgi:TolB protein
VFFQIELKGGNSILCRADADGGGFQRLTDGSVGYNYPKVSPDGTKLLCNGPDFQVFVMGVDSGRPRKIGTGEVMRMVPAWSSDSRRIAFGLLHGTPPNHTTEIGIMNADGSQDAAVTADKSVNEFPCWSPDGKQIAFQSCRDGNFEIYVMNADGTHPVRLTDDPKFDGAPSWGLINMKKN